MGFFARPSLVDIIYPGIVETCRQYKCRATKERNGDIRFKTYGGMEFIIGRDVLADFFCDGDFFGLKELIVSSITKEDTP